MLSGYQSTQGLQGLGCGVDTSCGCDRGMGSLLDPTTWGPADYLVALALGFAAYKLYGVQKQRSYTRKVMRRFED